ncbi:hypothetical protein SLUN_23775 [Streptomyces lunaelactis]|uniref:Lipoprotein n=1 Tax=Streptomyces lunaelactis TaxID=1535768 RepID=A0A2R4T6K9_9ACTN|nr:hypothetical protein [Streptomyces lunaelactis]AVZ74737.1 hypothetical protein SLUN_23775 [Streptomyces lunaelactis]NUK83889.1 hypothetical protein [Streptomyces lunaelactis]
MSVSVWRRGGVSLTAVAVIAGVAGCQGGDGEKKSTGTPRTETQSRTAVTQVLTAAYKKTAAAKSAKVRMTMTMPAAMDGGGTMEMSGVMGWDPTVMDMTMKGSMFAAAPTAPEQIRMVWLTSAMYVDMGTKASKEMDGKRWMKLDLGAAAEAAGGKALQKRMTGSLESMNQDPAQQLAMLLESPNLKHIGAEKVDGVEARHYKGTLTLDEMVASNDSLDALGEKERKDLLATMKKSGIKGYDTEVWVNEDDYPVKMDVAVDSPEGQVKIVANYWDYGAEATVQAPPAGETFDLMDMLKELGEGLKSAGQS